MSTRRQTSYSEGTWIWRDLHWFSSAFYSTPSSQVTLNNVLRACYLHGFACIDTNVYSDLSSLLQLHWIVMSAKFALGCRAAAVSALRYV